MRVLAKANMVTMSEPLSIDEWALLIAGLCFLVGALLWFRAGRRAADEQSAADHERDMMEVFSRAQSIIDLTTPSADTAGLPPTPVLSSVKHNLDRLDTKLGQLGRETERPRIAEAIVDLRRVGSLLSSAIDVERSLRVGLEPRSEVELRASRERIARRVAELDLAAEELIWLADSHPE